MLKLVSSSSSFSGISFSRRGGILFHGTTTSTTNTPSMLKVVVMRTIADPPMMDRRRLLDFGINHQFSFFSRMNDLYHHDRKKMIYQSKSNRMMSSLNLMKGVSLDQPESSHHHHHHHLLLNSSYEHPLGGIIGSLYQASSNVLWNMKKQLFKSKFFKNSRTILIPHKLEMSWEELKRKISNVFGGHRYSYYEYSSYGSGGEGSGFRFTNIQKIIALNVAVFVLANLFLTRQDILANLGVSLDNIKHGKIYTMFTSMFTHIDLIHIFMNMYALSQLGKMMPMTRRLLWPAYIFCGLVASSVYLLDKWIGSTALHRPHEYYTTGIGASGAIFGLLAFVTQVHPFIPVGIFFLPIQFKLRNFFYGVIAIECYRWYTNRDSSVSASGHLGGALGGYLFYLMNRKRLLF
ncbi:hypothetical protein FDP41_001443 [Naegleria fowleri]|nr:uncharacterized protein FDP41_001443 [Naegleria fowleri]KAF0979526.1 hypothetical protein FDP41_001443 [Naegleria fowleri]CAG4708426.1 unnamed protein product [Naegleria fowleri]